MQFDYSMQTVAALLCTFMHRLMINYLVNCGNMSNCRSLRLLEKTDMMMMILTILVQAQTIFSKAKLILLIICVLL